MRVVSLGSGSSGNALLIEAGPNGRTKLLVDAGFSDRILRERLRSAGVTLSQIQGILITHEHADHILGLPTIMKRYATPVVADPRTLAAIEQIFTTGILRSESGALVSLETEPGVNPGDHLIDDGSSNHSAYSRGGVYPRPGLDRLTLDHPDPWDALHNRSHSAHLDYIPLPVGAPFMISHSPLVPFPCSPDPLAP